MLHSDQRAGGRGWEAARCRRGGRAASGVPPAATQ